MSVGVFRQPVIRVRGWSIAMAAKKTCLIRKPSGKIDAMTDLAGFESAVS
jgi:hypothetical protein